jgi:hypothetical protein
MYCLHLFYSICKKPSGPLPSKDDARRMADLSDVDVHLYCTFLNNKTAPKMAKSTCDGSTEGQIRLNSTKRHGLLKSNPFLSLVVTPFKNEDLPQTDLFRPENFCCEKRRRPLYALFHSENASSVLFCCIHLCSSDAIYLLSPTGRLFTHVHL